MTTKEEFLTPGESLKFIEDAIKRTKDNIRESSFHFLLWGWLVAIASFSFFALHQYTSFQYYFLPFPLFSIAGIIASVIYYAKRATSTTVSYLGSFLFKMWVVLGISFFVVVFISVSQNHLPFTYTLVIAAVGTLASGLVMKFNPLTAGGVLFFAAAIASIYIEDDYKVLLHGVSIICGYLIPGYLLKSSSK